MNMSITMMNYNKLIRAILVCSLLFSGWSVEATAQSLRTDGSISSQLPYITQTLYRPTFVLPLDDLGSGVVNLVPTIAASPTPTFIRASVAWTKLSSGLWGQVTTGTARSSYLGRDTAVGAYGGYLSEPAGIQLVTPTAAIRDMTDASWVKVTTTVAKTCTGIDGSANSATLLTATAPAATVLQTLVAAASARTYSVFLRCILCTGAVSLMQGATASDISAQLNSSTYTRVQLNASVLNSAFGLRFANSSDSVCADFNQFEALVATQFASSPMVSAGAVRAADVLSYATAGNADATQGTCYAEVTANWTTSVNSIAVGFGAGGLMGTIKASTGVLSTQININDGTSNVTKAPLSDMFTGIRKRASCWGGAGMFITGDGAVPATTVFDGDMGSVAIGIGCGSDSLRQWSGTIANVRIYPRQVTSAQLSAMTAP